MLVADLQSSLEAFGRGAEAFFQNLSAIDWSSFGLALLFLLGMQLARAWAWRNVLRAAYPGTQISFLLLSAAYLAGAGINAILPARAGDVTKVFLVKRQIPHSSYPAVTSSFLVQSVFDTTIGILVLLYAITQGLLPAPPRLPDLPAFELSFWAENPKVFAATVAALLIGISIAIYVLAHRVRRFWDRVKQGVAILRTPSRYLREVAAWQGIGWLCRFAAFWFFLEAFGGDERAGDRQRHSLHPRRRRRPTGAPDRDPDRALAGGRPRLLGRHPDRDGRLVGRPRIRRLGARLPHQLAGSALLAVYFAGRAGRVLPVIW